MVKERDLDALIAERVMGVKLKTVQTYAHGDESLPEIHKYTEHSRIEDGDQYQPSDIHHYSTEIESAWIVVEKFKELKLLKVDGSWECIVSVDVGGGGCYSYYSKEKTAPMAICIAALKAKEDAV